MTSVSFPSWVIGWLPWAYLLALDATGCVLFLVASGAVDLLLTGDKGFGTDGGFADTAAEALLVPLSGLVFHLFGSWVGEKNEGNIVNID